jgi:hypothetical protein
MKRTHVKTISNILKHRAVTMTLAAVGVIILMSQAVCADVIFFKNGKMEQGYVEVKGNKYCVRDRVGGGEVEFYTGIVKKIEYGIWFEDLDTKIRSQAMTSIITNEPSAEDAVSTVVTTDWSFVETQPGEVDFETLMKDVNQTAIWMWLLGLALFAILMVVSFVCWIIVLVDAFKSSIWWGLGSVFIPIIFLIYLIIEYTGNKGRMFLLVYGPYIFIVLWWWMMEVYFPIGG